MATRRLRRTFRMLPVLVAVTAAAVVQLAMAVASGGQAPVPEVVEQAPSQGEAASAGELSPVDSEREAFVAEWADRIDAFNAGYPLEGYGYAFAEAAYDNDVDPRLPPAIARLESGSGQVCFLPYNAWGWGSASWSDWDTAIRAYVEGFAAGYGYTLTYETAQAYAPEEYEEWYPLLESVMAQI